MRKARTQFDGRTTRGVSPFVRLETASTVEHLTINNTVGFLLTMAKSYFFNSIEDGIDGE